MNEAQFIVTVNVCWVLIKWQTLLKGPPAYAGGARDTGLISGSGRSPGGGNGNPLQYSCLGKPMDRGAWWATVHGSQRVRHNWVTEHTHIHYSKSCHMFQFILITVLPGVSMVFKGDGLVWTKWGRLERAWPVVAVPSVVTTGPVVAWPASGTGMMSCLELRAAFAGLMLGVQWVFLFFLQLRFWLQGHRLPGL